ncbi:hypothetical protein L204_106309 [Cryptococcus depauperatus]|nr:cytoplasmic protein [Cryptococcus depauperatus CBS 7855]
MPVPSPPSQEFELFPALTRSQIDASRTSAWYETFADITTPATIIDLESLGEEEEFMRWLEADSIFLPEGSERSQPKHNLESERLRSDSNASDDSESSVPPVYHLPRLNQAIREAIEKYGGAVFPKLNWTSPKDAAFILPQTSTGPLHCSSPADVYLLLKSSDFISHGVDNLTAYSGTNNESLIGLSTRPKIELVLKKFENLNSAGEIRCFIRNRTLIGITQRDMNFYNHLQSEDTQLKICQTAREFFEDEIRENYEGGDDYVFDLYLSPNFQHATIIDFQPYRPSTDALLFTYEELLRLLLLAPSPENDHSSVHLPTLRVIDSMTHPAATRNAPAYQSNMLPLEMMEMSQGRNMAEFKEAWEDAIRAGMGD